MGAVYFGASLGQRYRDRVARATDAHSAHALAHAEAKRWGEGGARARSGGGARNEGGGGGGAEGRVGAEARGAQRERDREAEARREADAKGLAAAGRWMQWRSKRARGSTHAQNILLWVGRRACGGAKRTSSAVVFWNSKRTRSDDGTKLL
eukprot:SAG11_NODE_2484_length_3303_cov_14.286517_3_plen_151_part_00